MAANAKLWYNMGTMPGYSERHLGDERVFDDAFEAVSHNIDDQDRLQAIEVALTHNGKRYALAVETYGMHLARVEPDAEETETDGDPTLVIPVEEILPSDLVNIRHTPFEELEPYLVLQEPDDEI